MILLAKRIITCLDVKEGRTVKGVHFNDLKDAGDIVELAKKYSVAGADEKRSFSTADFNESVLLFKISPALIHSILLSSPYTSFFIKVYECFGSCISKMSVLCVVKNNCVLSSKSSIITDKSCLLYTSPSPRDCS